MDDIEPQDEPDDGGEPRVKDLLRRRELPARPILCQVLFDLLDGRNERRPAGNTPRTWMRVAGEDPFAQSTEGAVQRKTTYVDGRFVRIDQDEKEAARKKAGPARPTSPASWDKPDKSSNAGESAIPAGFRNLPSAKSAAKPEGAQNMGEALIPPGFRDVPLAKKPEPPRPKHTGPQPAPPPIVVPESSRTQTSTGRMMLPNRRQALNAPGSPPPQAAPLPPPPIERPAQRAKTDLFSDPRLSRPFSETGLPQRKPLVAPAAGAEPEPTPAPARPAQAPPAPVARPVAPPPAPRPTAATPPQAPTPTAAPPRPSPSSERPSERPPEPHVGAPLAPPKPPAPAGPPGPPGGGSLDDLFSSPLEGRARMSRRAAPTTPTVVKKDEG